LDRDPHREQKQATRAGSAPRRLANFTGPNPTAAPGQKEGYLSRRCKKGNNPKTRHTLEFAIPLPASTVTNQQVQDKALVRETILTLRNEGKSYRDIAKIVGLHFTRVRQILKQNN
jgi:hypothetical protein